MILQGKVIIVYDSTGIVEVFGREVDFNYWKLQEDIDIQDYIVEKHTVAFSVSVEMNQ